MKFQNTNHKSQTKHRTQKRKRFVICNLEFGILPKGFTLIEILVFIAVIVVVITIMWSGLTSFQESHQFNQGIEVTFVFLKDARTRTLASQAAKRYGVHFEETQIVLFEGASYNPANAISTFAMPSLIRISAISLMGGGQDVVFERLTGKTSQYGTINFASRRTAKNKTIQILSSGLYEAQ